MNDLFSDSKDVKAAREQNLGTDAITAAELIEDKPSFAKPCLQNPFANRKEMPKEVKALINDRAALSGYFVNPRGALQGNTTDVPNTTVSGGMTLSTLLFRGSIAAAGGYLIYRLYKNGSSGNDDTKKQEVKSNSSKETVLYQSGWSKLGYFLLGSLCGGAMSKVTKTYSFVPGIPALLYGLHKKDYLWIGGAISLLLTPAVNSLAQTNATSAAMKNLPPAKATLDSSPANANIPSMDKIIADNTPLAGIEKGPLSDVGSKEQKENAFTDFPEDFEFNF